MGNALVNLSNELAGIVREAGERVVSVRARRHYGSSGILWDAETVVTADQAIHKEEEISVVLPDGRSAAARVAGRDAGSDLAVLKIEAGGVKSPPARFAEAVQPGELALVIGRSPDSGVNASLGIVSAASGAWRTWRGGQLDGYIRLDARIFPQSPGGAVINARGELIGMATAALSRIAGLAVPAATVRRVAAKLIEKGFLPRGYLGIGIQPVPLNEELRTRTSQGNERGLILLFVEADGPAQKAGLLPGDILTAASGARIESTEDLQACSEASTIGKHLSIEFLRGGERKEAAVVVGERPGRRS